ncbi:MAG: AIR carboxylase family protein, partial [Bacteroidetes bacterium]|nr:AIR carboxylase family protein [Bacteroidota bacterium]
MPDGIPVGCVGIGESESAAILASQIAYNDDPEVRNKIRAYRGIEGEIPIDVRKTSLVGIIKASGTEVDERKYADAKSSMEMFGLGTSAFEIPVADKEAIRSVVSELEREGAV